ncbi:DUF1259 domain-containing protein [Paenibacillus dokdonensis]|uniref:DUF1259 domain-containing protein n=1 Tax=Paenibacillus dokdonensis TaxID=2567944 RepID=A0ABU6GUY4_9BACL|nr:DUF1259 domain-containing protein [Paenibacillus dokdonensis]MEC0242530.1 DUF1259 domain-containing protein [Paenibacillus dokdonensis]
MKKILMSLIVVLSLIIPTGTIMGAESKDCKVLEQVFGTKVKQENGVCRLEIMRKNIPVSNLGVQLSPEAIELGFGANFEKVGDNTAVIGEFALLSEEVNPVIDALRKGNVEISAVHNHLIGEQPQIIYLHFQGLGNVESLAKTVKEAIASTDNK